MSLISMSNTKDLHADLHSVFKQLRDDSPVHYLPEIDAYYVSRYDDVKNILSDTESFSNTAVRKMTYSGFYTGGMPPYPEGRARALVEVDQVIGSDPPDHGRLREHMAKPFKPRAIREYESRVRDICTSILDSLLEDDSDTINMVDFAVSMTLDVLALFVGIDTTKKESFRKWTVDFIAGVSASQVPEDFTESCAAMSDYLWELVEDRRLNPQEDIVTALVNAQKVDPKFTDDDVFVNLVLLLQAGHETTANTIGNAMHLFSKYPEQYQILRNDHSLIPAAIMEILRYDSPVTVLTRLTTKDIEVSGVTIPKGKVVMASVGSANLDENVIDEPETFDIQRNLPPVVPFGFGAHFCIGNILAKLEATVALQEIMKRFPTIEQADGDWNWQDSIIFRGPEQFYIKKPKTLAQ